MIDIIINKNQCKLEGNLDTNVVQFIDYELSYLIPGAIFMPAYQKGWNGRKHFLSNKLIFPKGLLDRVIKILNNFKIEYNIINKNIIVNNEFLNIYEKLKEINRIPYDYQIEATEKLTEKNYGILKAGCGAGKSLIMALVSAKLNKSTIIYVIGTSLLYQTYDFFCSIFGKEKIGIVGDGNCEIKFGNNDINIVSVWTAGVALGVDKKKIINTEDDSFEEENKNIKYDLIKELISKAKVHIIDECHVCGCDTIDQINKTMNAEYIYGFSASPYSDDGTDLLIESILGSITVNISSSYLIEKGYLTQPIIKFISVPKIMYPKNVRYQEIYKEYVIESEIRNKLVIDNTIDLVNKGYKVLVLFKNIKHGKILYNLLKDKIKCELLSGKDDQKIRDEAKLKMEKNEINCVIASNIFDIGLDWPFLSGLVLAGGGKSFVRAIQRVGRIARKYPNKKIAAVIEFLDLARHLKEHSLARKKVYETEPKFKIIWPQNKK